MGKDHSCIQKKGGKKMLDTEVLQRILNLEHKTKYLEKELTRHKFHTDNLESRLDARIDSLMNMQGRHDTIILQFERRLDDQEKKFDSSIQRLDVLLAKLQKELEK